MKLVCLPNLDDRTSFYNLGTEHGARAFCLRFRMKIWAAPEHVPLPSPLRLFAPHCTRPPLHTLLAEGAFLGYALRALVDMTLLSHLKIVTSSTRLLPATNGRVSWTLAATPLFRLVVSPNCRMKPVGFVKNVLGLPLFRLGRNKRAIETIIVDEPPYVEQGLPLWSCQDR